MISQCLDKRLTASVLEGLGYAVPRTVPVASPAALAAVDYFPVVVKPAVGAGGSRDVFLAQDAHELNALADYLGIDAGGTFFVQEYVGTPEHEYTVGVLVDMDGTYMNSIAMKRDLTQSLSVRLSARNRTSRLDLGERLVVSSGISQGTIGRFSEVTRACKDIAQAIGTLGAVNIQCRLDARGVRVFEINPRFSGTTALRAMAGYNEPDELLRSHFWGRRQVSDFGYWEGQILRGLIEYRIDE